MTTNPPPDARSARIYVATANVAVMDILSGREQGAHVRGLPSQPHGPVAAEPDEAERLEDRGMDLRVPKTYATWADVLHLAAGSVPRLVSGQVGGADLAEGAMILGLWA
jgi:hypothetical protein